MNVCDRWLQGTESASDEQKNGGDPPLTAVSPDPPLDPVSRVDISHKVCEII